MLVKDGCLQSTRACLSVHTSQALLKPATNQPARYWLRLWPQQPALTPLPPVAYYNTATHTHACLETRRTPHARPVACLHAPQLTLVPAPNHPSIDQSASMQTRSHTLAQAQTPNSLQRPSLKATQTPPGATQGARGGLRGEGGGAVPLGAVARGGACAVQQRQQGNGLSTSGIANTSCCCCSATTTSCCLLRLKLLLLSPGCCSHLH